MNLKVIFIAITAFGALSYSTVYAQTLLFQDDFYAGDTTQVDLISDPSSRGNGTLQNDIHYQARVMFGPTQVEYDSGSFADPPELRIHNNALDFSAGLSINGNGQIDAPFGDRYLRFEDSNENEYNWAPVLGDHYEISFQMHAAHNSPLGFSIADTVAGGNYRPDNHAAYDFGLSTWTGTWRIGEDGNKVDGDPSVDDFQGLGVATKGVSYDVRVVIDESNPQATAAVYIDDDATAIYTLNIDFEKNERYFQFSGRDNYGGTLDDLKITTYSAVPELNNFSLLTSLLLVTGLFVIRRSPQV